MSSEKSSRSTRDISCTEDIFNFERSYSAENGVLNSVQTVYGTNECRGARKDMLMAVNRGTN